MEGRNPKPPAFGILEKLTALENRLLVAKLLLFERFYIKEKIEIEIRKSKDVVVCQCEIQDVYEVSKWKIIHYYEFLRFNNIVNYHKSKFKSSNAG